ncbi:MAG: DNA primase [Deltaproteobacteria bacterium]|nr:DNA primase [Deltaproteobacteria bacterium]
MSKEDIGNIKTHIDIVAVVSEYVTLKRKGKSYWGLCPFHEEKTPSFQIDPARQMYKCFGCGAGGDVISFIMEIKGLSFYEAIKELAGRTGIPLRQGKTDRDRSSQKKAYYEVNSLAMKFYKEILFSPKGETALKYLKDRGIAEDIIKEFSLGYAPDSWDSLVNALKRKGVSMAIAAKSGLIAENKSGTYYDRFRDRIIFPIINLGGEVIGFGGRIIGSGEPKYLNTPETLIFKKRKVLYNLAHAKNYIHSEGVTIVEGYMDVISLYNAGVKNTVATLGTSLTQDHLRVLKRFTDKIRLVFDGDKAGKAAMTRAIEPFLKTDIIPEVVVLPEGKDPDDIASSSLDLWYGLISKAQSIWDFIFHESFSTRDTSKLEDKRIILKELVPLISRVEDQLIKDLLIERLSIHVGVEPSVIRAQIRSTNGSLDTTYKEAEDINRDLVEETLVRLMLFDTKAIKLIRELDLGHEFKQAHLVPLVKHMLEKGNAILEDPDCSDNVRRIASRYVVQGEISGDKEKALLESTSRFIRRTIEKDINNIQGEILKAEERKEKNRVIDLVKIKREKIMAIKNIHTNVAEVLQKI